jgi:mannose-6-phosphate isomerase-like protein (cupin superfamily)
VALCHLARALPVPQSVAELTRSENMNIINAADFTADRAWGAMDIAVIDGTSVRLHWSDQPYIWHINDGPEVFIVLDGEVDMEYRIDGKAFISRLRPGQIFYAGERDAHRAIPNGVARMLVIEREGSI